MWKMSKEEFNEWRRVNDYPRIISFLKKKLLSFDEWMIEQSVSDDLLIKYSPATFLRDRPIFYLYNVIHRGSEQKEILSEDRYAVNETFFHENLVMGRKEIVPYLYWIRRKNKLKIQQPFIDLRQGRSRFLLSELELLDLGNCELANVSLERDLDFVNLDGLRVLHGNTNAGIKLWFSSAVNVSIEGDLPFVDAYETRFYEVYNPKHQNLKLINGNFQNWSFQNCEVNLNATNANLIFWAFTGYDFSATISNTDILDCTFKSAPINYPIGFGRAKNFHAHVKRLYSQIGKKRVASEHYYLEKKYERKSFLHVKENYRNQYYKRGDRIWTITIRIAFLFRYAGSGFLNILWGYGERPSRVIYVSIATILLFATGYCYLPGASLQTHHNFSNALYFSTVTFTTLGYGDISQTSGLLKLLSCLEALLGLTFWGILIAGFTSNAKDY